MHIQPANHYTLAARDILEQWEAAQLHFTENIRLNPTVNALLLLEQVCFKQAVDLLNFASILDREFSNTRHIILHMFYKDFANQHRQKSHQVNPKKQPEAYDRLVQAWREAVEDLTSYEGSLCHGRASRGYEL